MKKFLTIVVVFLMTLSNTGLSVKAALIDGIPIPEGAENQVPAVNEPLSDLPAFPGADGYAKYVTGGRGGKVVHVTNLNSKGTGSLFEALTAEPSTPRTIVFDVSGYIDWPRSDDNYPLTGIANVTIAGQTAPGDGICITGGNFYLKGASNVIIRYMRFRFGQATEKDDSFYTQNGSNIMIDHCSFTWGSDESMSARENANLTVQWSIIADGFRTHSMGGLHEWNSESVHHTLIANQNDRNLKAKGFLDFTNNVLYNWGEYPYVAGGNSGGEAWGNVVNNYFIAGLDTKQPDIAICRANGKYFLYSAGNLIDSNKNGALDGISTGLGMVDKPNGDTLFTEKLNVPDQSAAIIMKNRMNMPKLDTIDSAETAYYKVINYSGASLKRDRIDQDLIDSVVNQTGKLLLHHDQVGGFCKLESSTAPKDTDKDGMPDSWEDEHGLNAYNAEDRNNIAASGYTYLEEYLNELAAQGFPEENYTPYKQQGNVRDYKLQLQISGENKEYPLYQTQNHVMVPLKPVAEYLGFRTEENGQSLTIEYPFALTDSLLNLDIKAGKHTITAGDTSFDLSSWTSLNQEAQYKDGMLYVPITMVALCLGSVYNQSSDGTITVEDAGKYSYWHEGSDQRNTRKISAPQIDLCFNDPLPLDTKQLKIGFDKEVSTVSGYVYMGVQESVTDYVYYKQQVGSNNLWGSNKVASFDINQFKNNKGQMLCLKPETTYDVIVDSQAFKDVNDHYNEQTSIAFKTNGAEIKLYSALETKTNTLAPIKPLSVNTTSDTITVEQAIKAMYRLSKATDINSSDFDKISDDITTQPTTPTEPTIPDDGQQDSDTPTVPTMAVQDNTSSINQQILADINNKLSEIVVKVNAQGSILLNNDTLQKLIERKKDIVAKTDSIAVTLKSQLLGSNLIKDSKGNLEIDINASSAEMLDKVKANKEINLLDAAKLVFNVSLKTSSEIKSITGEEPILVSMDLSKYKIEDLSKLTAIRYESQNDGSIKPIKIGGNYDKEKNTFSFYTDRLGTFSIAQTEVSKLTLTIDSKESSINGVLKSNDVAPVIINNTTMVPARFIAENLCATVSWDENTQQVSILMDNKKLKFKIGEKLEGSDVEAIVKDGRTLVPIRYISEKVGANVLWIPSSNSVEIVK